MRRIQLSIATQLHCNTVSLRTRLWRFKHQKQAIEGAGPPPNGSADLLDDLESLLGYLGLRHLLLLTRHLLHREASRVPNDAWTRIGEILYDRWMGMCFILVVIDLLLTTLKDHSRFYIHMSTGYLVTANDSPRESCCRAVPCPPFLWSAGSWKKLRLGQLHGRIWI